MKHKYHTILATICGAMFISFAASQTAHAATLTWDPADTGNGTTIDPGDGTWNTITSDTGGTNIVWNDAGTNKIWAQTSTTASLHSAVFGGADGTYAITVGEALAAGSVTFNNSGYTLSAASATTIRVTAPTIITVAAGKSATIGTNVSVQKNGGGAILDGEGTLNITGTEAKVRTSAGNLPMRMKNGLTVNVGTGGLLLAGSSIIVGETASAAALNVTGGSVTLGGDAAANLFALANEVGAGPATVTLTSGTIRNSANSGGLRFGSNLANTSSSTFHLDGGTLTVATIFEGDAGHSSTFNFNGGTLTTEAGSTLAGTFMQGIDTVNVRNGGAIFDTNGIDTTVGQALAHSAIGGDDAIDGGLTKNGAGKLTLNGANTYTGITKVNVGTLALNGSSINNANQLTIDGGVVDLTGAETVSTLFFGATPQAAGTWGSSSSVPTPDNVDDTRFSGTGTLIVNPAPVSGYAAWQAANSTTQAAGLDHDNDGVSNGVEHFLFGTTDSTGNSNPLPGVDLSPLSVTWTKAGTYTGNYGSDFVVETSATLSDPWATEIADPNPGFTVTFPSANEVKYTFPAGTKNFARLKVVAP